MSGDFYFLLVLAVSILLTIWIYPKYLKHTRVISFDGIAGIANTRFMDLVKIFMACIFITVVSFGFLEWIFSGLKGFLAENWFALLLFSWILIRWIRGKNYKNLIQRIKSNDNYIIFQTDENGDEYCIFEKRNIRSEKNKNLRCIDLIEYKVNLGICGATKIKMNDIRYLFDIREKDSIYFYNDKTIKIENIDENIEPSKPSIPFDIQKYDKAPSLRNDGKIDYYLMDEINKNKAIELLKLYKEEFGEEFNQEKLSEFIERKKKKISISDAMFYFFFLMIFVWVIGYVAETPSKEIIFWEIYITIFMIIAYLTRPKNKE